jgi:SAM-dependent methyltransferase
MSSDLAAAYDDVYRAKRPNRKALRRDRWPATRAEACVRFAPGGRRVLDVGCGSGVVLYNLRDKYEELHGLELSAQRVATARQTLEGLPAEIRTGNIEAGTDYAAGSFDTIVLSDVIEHIVNLWPAVEEMKRLLRPGGQVVLSTPNVASLRRRLTLLRGEFPSTAAANEGFDVRTEHELHDKGHLHYFTYSMLRKLFARYAFSDFRGYGIGRLGRLHDLAPGMLSSCCMVVATK